MKPVNALRVPLIAAVIAAAPAFAASNNMLEHTERVLEGAKTSLSEAVSAAENQVGGKAFSARLAHSHKQDFFDVRVLKGDRLTDVRVGIDDGKIISTRSLERGHMAKTKATAPEKVEQPGNNKG